MNPKSYKTELRITGKTIERNAVSGLTYDRGAFDHNSEDESDIFFPSSLSMKKQKGILSGGNKRNHFKKFNSTSFDYNTNEGCLTK